MQEFSGSNVIFRGTDGCSAPVFFLEIAEMARIFAQLASGKQELLNRSFSIMRAGPYMIGGLNRFDTDLMRNKRCHWESGRRRNPLRRIPSKVDRPAMGLAVKIADGNFRALYPVVTSILKTLGVLDEQQWEKLAYSVQTPLKNHRKKEIGYIRSL
jgi:L-asparaginase II